MLKTTVRDATIEDTDLILRFIYELAKFEKAEHMVETSKEKIIKTIFGKNAIAHAVIAELGGCPVGHAVYFFSYSTCQGKNGLYIEDLYISSGHQRSKVGKEIIKYLSCIALEKGCSKIELSVFNWNKPAIRFYEFLKAEPQNGLSLYRLSDRTLKEIATA
jgi:GNAT superfamily N-acetyltransferase